MIELVVISFIAGVLTVLAPCILPLLPVVLGGSLMHEKNTKASSLKHPLIIVTSLAVSVVLFSLLLKATTSLLGIPAFIWGIVAGVILLLFGLNLLFPAAWDRFMIATNLQAGANRLMGKSQARRGVKRDILLGASLGPVFNSCSPTYALIIAVLLPASFASGILYLICYALGLSAILLLLAVFGRALADKLKWLSNPEGTFKKVIGVIFIVVGLGLVFGIDKKVQTFVLENGWYDPVAGVEEALRK